MSMLDFTFIIVPLAGTTFTNVDAGQDVQPIVSGQESTVLVPGEMMD